MTLAPDAVLGVEPVRRRTVTAEKVAINAVMAGCLPPYLPVVATAVQAMCEEPFLDHVERILRTEHGVRAVLRRRKPNMSAPAPAAVMAELVACDAVVSAVGD